jgi:hypothetical protein
LLFFFFLFKADYRGVLEQSAGLCCFFFKSDDQHAGLEHYCRRDILKCSGAIRGNICPASKHSDVVYLLCTVFAHRLSILYSVALLLSLLSARGIMVKVAEKLVELAVELSDQSPKSMDSTSPFVRLTCEPAILPESSISPIQMLSSVLLTVLKWLHYYCCCWTWFLLLNSG